MLLERRAFRHLGLVVGLGDIGDQVARGRLEHVRRRRRLVLLRCRASDGRLSGRRRLGLLRQPAAAVAALASSPSPASSAIGRPTFTPSVPSGTRILAILPSSTASNSIVALSVSISARMSPDLTSSPSLTSHLASVPSSIVGDRAGILSSIAISSSPPARRCRARPASGSGASSANFAASTTISLISLSIALSSSSLTPSFASSRSAWSIGSRCSR